MAKCWLSHTYEASFLLDPEGPKYTASVLREVQLPRWWYDSHDMGTAIFARMPQKRGVGETEVRLRLAPDQPRPAVHLEVSVKGNWDREDETLPPGPEFADILEEAEALLVLLGCRSPRFHHVGTKRVR